MDELRYHNCGDNGEPVYDARGIYLCRACPRCRKAKLAGYRREVLEDPSYEADEPIDGEDYDLAEDMACRREVSPREFDADDDREEW